MPLTRRQFNHMAAGLAATSALNPQWDEFEESIVIDTLGSPGPFNTPNRMAHPLTDEMVRNAIESGITAINVTVNQIGNGPETFAGTVRGMAYFEREIATHPEAFLRVTSVEDIREAKRTGRMGIIHGFQDCGMFQEDLDRVDDFYHLGLRIVQLTYNLRNYVGDGCLEPGDAGLSKFGHALVGRLNELGILVDASHCSTRTTDDAIAASSKPVGITHSGCKAVYDHPRSKSDATLKAMADKGGVIGLFLMPFLNAEGPARTAHLLDHIEHAVNVCGEDHVGIGSDQSTTPIVHDAAYDAMLAEFGRIRNAAGIAAPREDQAPYLPDLNHPTRMEMIADGLLERGHGSSRVAKIIGGNWMRVFEEVW